MYKRQDGTRWQAPFYLAYLMAPTVPVYDQFGRFYGEHKNFFMGGNNPVGHLYDDRRELSQMRLTDVFEVSYEIMEGLTIKSDWSFDLLKVEDCHPFLKLLENYFPNQCQ